MTMETDKWIREYFEARPQLEPPKYSSIVGYAIPTSCLHMIESLLQRQREARDEIRQKDEALRAIYMRDTSNESPLETISALSKIAFDAVSDRQPGLPVSRAAALARSRQILETAEREREEIAAATRRTDNG